jgi:acetyl-CoA C-acetyltransferase
MRAVAIVGIGATRFGRTERPLLDLMCDACLEAFDDAQLGDRPVDAVYAASMGALRNNHISAVASALADRLCLQPAAPDTLENGSASGASAVKSGVLAVASGYYDRVLVCGGERMRGMQGVDITDFIATVTHREAEYIYGATLPGLAGLFARAHMQRYGVTQRDLARVAVKNHRNAMLNPRAHLRFEVTLEQLFDDPHFAKRNPLVADPLRRFDCCPVSDGAAALLMVPADQAARYNDRAVRVAGLGHVGAVHAVSARANMLDLEAVRLAAERAYALAGIQAKQIDVAELHDAFTILEIVESEAVGFFDRGQGHVALAANETARDGSLPINPSGGLKARGHPVGATGVSQVVEVVRQLRGEAGGYQVSGSPQAGFAVNLGGFSSNAVATVLTRSL